MALLVFGLTVGRRANPDKRGRGIHTADILSSE